MIVHSVCDFSIPLLVYKYINLYILFALNDIRTEGKLNKPLEGKGLKDVGGNIG